MHHPAVPPHDARRTGGKNQRETVIEVPKKSPKKQSLMGFKTPTGSSSIIISRSSRSSRTKAAERFHALSTSASAYRFAAPLRSQVSLHTCPKALFRELRHVFPGVDLDACLAVPTAQRADMDLVAFGDTVENEKDRLLNSVRRMICFR